MSCIVQVFRHPSLSVDNDSPIYLAVACVLHRAVSDFWVELFTLFFQERFDIHLAEPF